MRKSKFTEQQVESGTTVRTAVRAWVKHTGQRGP